MMQWEQEVSKGFGKNYTRNNKNAFPGLETNYLPAAKAAFDLFQGYGIAIAWCAGGPNVHL